VLALTATAPQAVARDICRQLRIADLRSADRAAAGGSARSADWAGAVGAAAAATATATATGPETEGAAGGVAGSALEGTAAGAGGEAAAPAEAPWLHRAGGWSRANLTLSVLQFGTGSGGAAGGAGTGSGGGHGGSLSPQRLKAISDALTFQVLPPLPPFTKVRLRD